MDDPRIEHRPPGIAVGLCRRGATDPGGTARLWQGFMPRRQEIPDRRGAERLSIRVFHAQVGEPLTPETPFDEWAAVEVAACESLPDAMERLDVPGGTYAVFVHHGPAAALPRTARFIFQTWLPRSEYDLDARPHLAVMGPGYRPDDPHASEEIWVPVVERRSS